MRRSLQNTVRCFNKKLPLVVLVVCILAIISMGIDRRDSDRSVYTTSSTAVNVSGTTPLESSTLKEISVQAFTETPVDMSQTKHNQYQHPFRYIYSSTRCTQHNQGPFLLILVKSNVKNLDNRMAIRSTWGNISDSNIGLVFLLGNYPLLKDSIRQENSIYGDIVQEDFIDHYNNNTLKTIMGFTWSVNNCKNTSYFFFVDDDYLVNIRLLLKELHKRKPGNVFWGCVWKGAKPNRDKRSKWYISRKEYPHKFWPPYATGGSIVITRDYATRMIESFKHIKPLFIDDVYLGIVAKHLGIPLTNDCRFHPYYSFKHVRDMFSIHHFESPTKLLIDWESVKEDIKG